MSNLLLVLLDQFFVSFGNFITLALGAHFLSMNEQGKLCYVVSLYTISVLLNVSLIFSVAPIVKKTFHKISPMFYRQQLLFFQILVAAFIALFLCIFLYLFKSIIHSEFNFLQIILIFIFLFAQQIADFFRRSAYIFEFAKNALIFSFVLYISRILMIFIFHPSNLSEILFLLLLSALFGLTPIFFIYRKKVFKLHKEGIHKISIFQHLNLSKWNVISAPIAWASFFFPAFLLGYLESPRSAGIYLSVRSMSSIANILLEILETFIPKWLADFEVKLELIHASIKLILFGSFLWCTGLFIFYLFGKHLLFIFFGESYSNFSNYLIIFWIGNGIHFITRVFGLYYRTNKNTFFEFIGTFGGLLGLLISIPLIIHSSILGAVISSVIVPACIFGAQFFYFLFFIKKYKLN